MRHDDGVGAVGQARGHGGLVLEHVQAAPAGASIPRTLTNYLSNTHYVGFPCWGHGGLVLEHVQPAPARRPRAHVI